MALSVSDEHLWRTAQSLVKEHGEDFADSLRKKPGHHPLIVQAFSQRKLPLEDQAAVCELMQRLPTLAGGDDGSDQWAEEAQQFFHGVRAIMEERLSSGITTPTASTRVAAPALTGMADYVQAYQDRIQGAQGREPKFLRLALTDPANIEKSFRSNVANEKAQWHNTLVYQSRLSPNPYWADLLLAGADLLYAEAFEDLLGPEGIKQQVLISSRNWVGGMHADKTAFRHDLVAFVGELLENPEERKRLEETLQRIGSKAVLPEATPAELREVRVLEIQSLLGAFLTEKNAEVEEDLADYQAMGGPINPEKNSDQIILDAMANPASYQALKPETWLMLARQFAVPNAPAVSAEQDANRLSFEFFNRIKAHVIGQLDPAVAFPAPPAAPATAPPARRPRP